MGTATLCYLARELLSYLDDDTNNTGGAENEGEWDRH